MDESVDIKGISDEVEPAVAIAGQWLAGPVDLGKGERNRPAGVLTLAGWLEQVKAVVPFDGDGKNWQKTLAARQRDSLAVAACMAERRAAGLLCCRQVDGDDVPACVSSAAQTARQRTAQTASRGAWACLTGVMTGTQAYQGGRFGRYEGSGILTLELSAYAAGMDESELRNRVFEHPAALAAWLGPYAGQVYLALAMELPASGDSREYGLERVAGIVALEGMGLADAVVSPWPATIRGAVQPDVSWERVVLESLDSDALVRADGDAITPLAWRVDEPADDEVKTAVPQAPVAMPEPPPVPQLAVGVPDRNLRREWQELPLELGPKGDAFRMMLAAPGRLLVAKPDPVLAPMENPSLYVLPDTDEGLRAGRWVSDLTEAALVLMAASGHGREGGVGGVSRVRAYAQSESGSGRALEVF